MSHLALQEGGDLIGFPRVSGDEPGSKMQLRDVVRFSPRERG